MPSYGMYPEAMKKATEKVAGKKKDERESASMKQREYDMGEQMEAQMEKKKQKMKKLKVRKFEKMSPLNREELPYARKRFNAYEND